jgi:hypothetical protein
VGFLVVVEGTEGAFSGVFSSIFSSMGAGSTSGTDSGSDFSVSSEGMDGEVAILSWILAEITDNPEEYFLVNALEAVEAGVSVVSEGSDEVWRGKEGRSGEGESREAGSSEGRSTAGRSMVGKST